jgi:hypothetical protein
MVIVGLALLTGCATSKQVKYQRGKGDAGVFIVERAIALGAERVSTNSLPPIYSAWEYRDLGSAVVVRLLGVEREAFDRVLREAFSRPENVDFYDEGLPGDATPIGFAIQAWYHLLPSQVKVCVYFNNRRIHATLSNNWLTRVSTGSGARSNTKAADEE